MDPDTDYVPLMTEEDHLPGTTTDSDDDYLDDLSASGDEEGQLPSRPPSRAGTRAQTNGTSTASAARQTSQSGERMVSRLARPYVVEVTCKALYEQWKSEEIDLNAEYQRDVVWPDKNQSHLIDSIFRRFYVPPVVFAKQDDGIKEIRICVDGKQRLTSVFNFMAGKIPYIHKGYKYFWHMPTGRIKNAKLLPSAWKEAFEHSFITTVTFVHLKPTEEREIFQRVQLGLSLSTPEKWQALQGPWPDFLRELRASYFDPDSPETNILKHIGWDVRREKDFEDLVRMAFAVQYIVFRHEMPPIAPGPTGLALTDPAGPSETMKQTLTGVLQKLLELARNRKYEYAFEDKVAPVELVMIAVLLAMAKNHLHDDMLANGVKQLRKYIRANTPQGYVQWKPPVIKTALKFIGDWTAANNIPYVPVITKANKKGKGKDTATPAEEPTKKRKAPPSSSSTSAQEASSSRTVKPKIEPTDPTLSKVVKVSDPSSSYPLPKHKKAKYEVRFVEVEGKAPKPKPSGAFERVAPAPIVSRAELLSQPAKSQTSTPSLHGANAYHSSFTATSAARIQQQPTAASSTSYGQATTNVRAGMSSNGASSTGFRTPSPALSGSMPFEQQIDQISQEIVDLHSRIAQGGPDQQALENFLRQKESQKASLKAKLFLQRNNRQAGSSSFGGMRGPLAD